MTAAWIVLAVLAAMIGLTFVGRRQYAWTIDDTGAVLKATRDPYWFRCLDALDIFANVLMGGLEGETISARCGRWALVVHGHGVVWHWIAGFMVRWLDVIQPDHGQRAIAGALGRSQQLVEIETAALAMIVLKSAPV